MVKWLWLMASGHSLSTFDKYFTKETLAPSKLLVNALPRKFLVKRSTRNFLGNACQTHGLLPNSYGLRLMGLSAFDKEIPW